MKFTTHSKRVAGVVVAAAVAISLAGCSSPSQSTSDSGDSLGMLKVGSLAIPAGELITWLNEHGAKDAGLELKWTEFTDYNTPNTSLSNGEI
ncbi:MAG: MetQ/NlpA family ABC transporter substrate-binding protein, partial [Terrimesophilobacter sp.]